ncbi:MAG: hypothetical protein LW825_02875 [Candidatus Jidaibacter sp.]|jgi:hypothetical protein|nr:hypothetical protein [Candidatus Jidaibacter sp.]
MSENMALEQFRINMMQGGGGGGMETGGASGSSFMEFNGFLSELRPPSPENMQRKIQAAFKSIVSLLEATKGSASQLTLSSLGLFGPQMQLPHGFIASSAKVPAGLISPGKGGH